MFDIGFYDLARIMAIYCLVGCFERAFRLFFYVAEIWKAKE